jgi:CTP synthase
MEILNDFDTTVRKALDEIDPSWEIYPGLIVCGSHAPKELADKVFAAIKKAREDNKPFLGLCMGFQMSLVEFARNVLGLVDANSTELDPDTTAPIIVKMPELRVGMKPVLGRMESFWHNYKFNPEYSDLFIANGWRFVTQEVLVEGQLMGHKFFSGTQYHPEYQSTTEQPHQILKEFLHHARMAM